MNLFLLNYVRFSVFIWRTLGESVYLFINNILACPFYLNPLYTIDSIFSSIFIDFIYISSMTPTSTKTSFTHSCKFNNLGTCSTL